MWFVLQRVCLQGCLHALPATETWRQALLRGIFHSLVFFFSSRHFLPLSFARGCWNASIKSTEMSNTSLLSSLPPPIASHISISPPLPSPSLYPPHCSLSFSDLFTGGNVIMYVQQGPWVSTTGHPELRQGIPRTHVWLTLHYSLQGHP